MRNPRDLWWRSYYLKWGDVNQECRIFMGYWKRDEYLENCLFEDDVTQKTMNRYDNLNSREKYRIRVFWTCPVSVHKRKTDIKNRRYFYQFDRKFMEFMTIK